MYVVIKSTRAKQKGCGTHHETQDKEDERKKEIRKASVCRLTGYSNEDGRKRRRKIEPGRQVLKQESQQPFPLPTKRNFSHNGQTSVSLS